MANGHTNPRQWTDTHCRCISCLEWRGNNEFGANKQTQNGLAYYCKECANGRARKNHSVRYHSSSKYKDAKRSAYIKNRHGIDAETYEAMLAAQDYSCAICGVELSSRGHGTHLDHCHTSGKLRAMLCTNCNRGLGHFQDNVDFLESAIEYLRQHNESACSHKEGTNR